MLFLFSCAPDSKNSDVGVKLEHKLALVYPKRVNPGPDWGDIRVHQLSVEMQGQALEIELCEGEQG